MRLLLFFILAGHLLALDSRYVTYTDAELLAHGDFNSDSSLDLLIIQRDTGQFRIAFGSPSGSLTWENARPSGITDVSGVATGPFLVAGYDQIAVTSPSANRIALIDASSSITSPTLIQPSGLGPETLAAIEFPGLPSNDTTILDLFTTSSANGVPFPRKSHLLRGTTSGHSDQQTNNDGFLRKRPGRTKVLNSQVDILTFISNEAGEDILRTFIPSSFPSASFTAAALGGNNYEYTHGSFISSLPDRNQFLTWEPGSNTLQVIPTVSSGKFSAPVITTLALGPIDTITPIQTSSSLEFLVIADNGNRAATFTLDNTSNPVQGAEFLAPEGRRFSLPSGFALDRFTLLTKPLSGGSSNQAELFTHDGTTWNPTSTQTLPEPLPDSTLANVFLFDGEPLVDLSAELRETLHIADWTANFSITPAGVVTLTNETYGSASTGLGSPNTGTVGTFGNATHGLPNQPQAEFSLTNNTAPLGPLPPQVTVDPPGGTYTRYVQPVITSNANAFYRTGSSDSWTPATASPITLPGSTLETVVLEYYAVDSSTSLRSPIYSATYQFNGIIDSDGDGAPDFVELAKGISDPTFGSDSDEDGHDDLSELLANTDAQDPASTPSSREASANTFSLTVTPLSHNTASPGASDRPCAFDTNLRAYATTGGILAQIDTGSSTSGTLTDLPASPRDSFTVVATDPNFTVLQGGLVNVPEGRELLGLVPIPDVTPEPFEFSSGGGSASIQADQWLSQYQTYLNNRPQTQLTETLTLEDTLSLLLIERILALEFADDDPTFNPDTFTLTPHRDPGLTAVTSTQLLNLQRQNNPTDSILLRTLYDHIQSAFIAPATSVSNLLFLANDLYRISCSEAEDNPGLYPSTVDTLREFLRNAPLAGEPDELPTLPGDSENSSYTSEGKLVDTELISANNALRELHASLPRRIALGFNIQITANTFLQDVPIVGREAGSILIAEALFDLNGNPYRFPAEFDLPIGTRLAVSLYDDRTNTLPSIPGTSTSWEVHSATILSYPEPANTDSDGNLLDDNWETYFFTAGGNAFNDSDNDGYTDLQEQLEHTNPLSSGSTPTTTAFPAGPPPISIEAIDSDNFLLSLTFPTIYSDDLAFTLQTNTGLLTFPLGTQEAIPSGTDPNTYTLTIPKPTFEKSFYRFSMSLRE